MRPLINHFEQANDVWVVQRSERVYLTVDGALALKILGQDLLVICFQGNSELRSLVHCLTHDCEGSLADLQSDLKVAQLKFSLGSYHFFKTLSSFFSNFPRHLNWVVAYSNGSLRGCRLGHRQFRKLGLGTQGCLSSVEFLVTHSGFGRLDGL